MTADRLLGFQEGIFVIYKNVKEQEKIGDDDYKKANWQDYACGMYSRDTYHPW